MNHVLVPGETFTYITPAPPKPSAQISTDGHVSIFGGGDAPHSVHICNLRSRSTISATEPVHDIYLNIWTLCVTIDTGDRHMEIPTVSTLRNNENTVIWSYHKNGQNGKSGDLP